jgi:tetratricopeptide (TPR) repeat protein
MSEPNLAKDIDVETLDDQLDAIFHELKLALQWKRPSILFAIYDSSAIRSSAQDTLEKLILEAGQKVVHYQIEYEESLNLTQFVSEITQKEDAVFYIDPLNSEGKNSQINHLVTMLNSCRGYLVDHLVRVVFWLTENEALCVAHEAPDFWASRHRVFEFVHGKIEEKLESFEPVSLEPEKGEKMQMSISSGSIDDDISGESALVFDLSEGEEPTISGINLLLMMGVANWKEGNHERACESLQAALAIAEKSGNKSHQAMCQKAIALVKTDSGNHDSAIQAYNRVVELGPENVTIWNNIGVLYQKTGRFEDAQKAFNNALQKDPNDPVSWHGLGNVYASTARLDEAINCYRKAIQFNAGYMQPWVKLGDVLLRQNRNDDALYAYMRTVEMDNKNVHAWTEIGSIYFKAGSYEQAVDAYKKALILGVDSAALYGNLADAYTHSGNYAEAIPNFEKAIEREDDTEKKAVLWNKLGDVHRRISDYENAVGAYEMADKLSITLGDIATENILVKTQQGMEAAVNKNVDRETNKGTEPAEPTSQGVGSESNPTFEVHATAAVTTAGAPATQQIEDTAAVSGGSTNSGKDESHTDPNKARLWTRLGSTYMKAGAIDRAVDAYRKAVDMDPTDGQVYQQLAQVYVQKKEMAKAISYYGKSIDLFSSDQEKAITLSQIGDLYRQMQQFENAFETFEAAISLDPENETILAGLSKIQEDLDQLSNIDKLPDAAFIRQGTLPGTDTVKKPLPKVAVTGSPTGVLNQTAMNGGVKDVGDMQDEQAAGIKTGLNNANVWNELGNIFAKSKAFDEAIEAYDKAIELNPEFGWSYSNLALIYSRQGKRDKAVNLYQKSIALLWADADKAVAWNRLGDTYRQAGKYAEAIDAYQNADRLNQGNQAVSAIREANIEQLFPHFVS